MAKIKLIVDRKAVREILKRTVAPDITARARRIAAAAGEGYEVQTGTTPTRFRAEVHTTTSRSTASERKHHRLLGALNAGRG